MAAKPWLKFIVERMSHIGFYQFLEEDFIKLNDRIRHYMDWSVNEIHFLALKEVHDIFKVMELFCNFFVTVSLVSPVRYFKIHSLSIHLYSYNC